MSKCFWYDVNWQRYMTKSMKENSTLYIYIKMIEIEVQVLLQNAQSLFRQGEISFQFFLIRKIYFDELTQLRCMLFTNYSFHFPSASLAPNYSPYSQLIQTFHLMIWQYPFLHHLCVIVYTKHSKYLVECITFLLLQNHFFKSNLLMRRIIILI